MELFDRTPQERIDGIRKVLKGERRMRERVFAKKPDLLERKLSEIDAALEHLDALEEEVIHEGPAS